MTRLGYAEESPYRGPIKLDGDPKGASVIIFGAGLAGMTAAIELRARGLQGQPARIQCASGRTELDAERRRRLHRTRRRDAALRIRRRPLSQSRAVAHSLPSLRDSGLLPAFRRDARAVHPAQPQRLSAFRPMRSAASRSAFATSRPISMAASPSFWPRRRRKGRSTTPCRRKTRKSCSRRCGRSARSTRISATGRARFRPYHRGYAKHPGGGLGAEPVAGEPIGLHDILTSRLWRGLQSFLLYDFQTTMFQPVGGMGRIGEAFARQIPDRIRYGAKVIAIEQNDSGVTVAFEDIVGADGYGGSGDQGRLVRLHAAAHHPQPNPDQRVRADEGGDRRRSLCVRGEIRAAVLAPVLGGGRAHFRRHQLHRPADPPDFLSERRLQRGRQGRAARRIYVRRTERLRVHGDAAGRAGEARGRVRRADSSAISRPSSRTAFRSPGIASRSRLGCAGDWSDEAREAHYDDLCQIDGRIVLAGEHASYIPAWQEGAILSALDAIQRLHKRVVAS